MKDTQFEGFSKLDSLKISKFLKSKYAEAKEIIKDPVKFEELINQFKVKASSLPKTSAIDLESIICYVLDYALMIRLYFTKESEITNMSSALGYLAAIIYVVCPIDVMPDFIPGIGLLDDVAVLYMIVNAIKVDVDLFRASRIRRSF